MFPFDRQNARRALAPLVAAAALALLTSACGSGKGSAQGAPGSEAAAAGAHNEKPVPVAVERASRGPIASYYTATATIEAENTAEIVARTTGVVRQILHEEGDRVGAGAELLRLEDDEARLRVQQAQANASMAQTEHDRRESMREAGLLSAEEFETSQNTLRVRTSELDLAKLELEYTRITAPFAGRVVRRLVDLGAHVSPGTPLFQVMDDEPLLARVHVPSRRMGYVRPGQEIDLHLDSGDVDVTGVVTLVSPIVDANTGTVKVTAEIRRHPDGIRPGDFAQVKVVTERHPDVVLVPSRSVVEDEGQQVVYVAVDGKAVRRPVETGFVEGDLTEITGGLEAGELICTKGQRDLRDGAVLSLLEGPADVVAAAQVASAAADSSAPTAATSGAGAGKP